MTGKPNRTVLHVDDSDVIRQIVQDHLQAHGYDVISLGDPTQVLDTLLSTDCQVAICDIQMPELNGLDLLEQIKEMDGGVQVIMLTGVVDMSTILRSMRRGAEACIFKPIDDPTLLLEALDDVFRKRDRWWQSLRISLERKAEREALTAADQ